ncbi:MAG TPA: twin-arginine translocase TatA/TatE family subunit [Gammaproteobacteria bacterium]
MGLSGISIWQLLIILLIVVLIFGTKRLKTLGSDLGSALKSFRQAMEKDDEAAKKAEEQRHLEADRPDAEFAEQKDKTTQA